MTEGCWWMVVEEGNVRETEG